MTDYKKKYLKYKTKYLQLAGSYISNDNSSLDPEKCIETPSGEFDTFDECIEYNSWKESFQELYYFLLKIIDDMESIMNYETKHKMNRLCSILLHRVELVYFKLQESNQGFDEEVKKKIILKKQRMINYDMRFIFNILSMLFGSPLTSEIENKLIEIETRNKIDFNRDGVLNDRNFYYIEDCYTNDLELFFSEYDKLVLTKKSSFFYKSNLVNISILLKCFDTRCIERIMDESGYYHELKKKIHDTVIQFNTIFSNFQTIKKDLIKILLGAYKDFEYKKVKELYIRYLTFHYENFRILYISGSNYEESWISIFKNITESGSNYFIYLSCNIVSEFKYFKFEFCRILISFIGLKKNDDNFFNTIRCITHDFQEHQQYIRKLSYSDEELIFLRSVIINLYKIYDNDEIILTEIIIFIHNANHENDLTKLSIEKIIRQIVDYFTITRRNIIYTLIFPHISKFGDEYNNDLFKILKNDNKNLLLLKLLKEGNIYKEKHELSKEEQQTLINFFIKYPYGFEFFQKEIYNVIFDEPIDFDFNKILPADELKLFKQVFFEKDRFILLYIKGFYYFILFLTDVYPQFNTKNLLINLKNIMDLYEIVV
jgi:hypothetical protein